MAKISVCIPTYNGAKYIKEQLESILVQLKEDDEVIVSDDRSSDKTIEVIESLNDHRITILRHPEVINKHRGHYYKVYALCCNVENALKHATGDYIFLSDQDDIWLPNKVARVVEELDRGVECVLHDNRVVDNDMNTLMESYFTFSRPSGSWLQFFTFNPYQGASMAFNRRILNLSLPFNRTLPIGHDHWIACAVWSHKKQIAIIREPLLLYRRHDNNVSAATQKSNNGIYFKVSYRFNLFINFIRLLLRRSK